MRAGPRKEKMIDYTKIFTSEEVTRLNEVLGKREYITRYEELQNKVFSLKDACHACAREGSELWKMWLGKANELQDKMDSMTLIEAQRLVRARA